MKLFIPSISSKLTLTKPWTFRLFVERRNRQLLDRIGFDANTLQSVFKTTCYIAPDHSVVVTFPQGTTLSVDRIYIKRGSPSYNSISFRVKFDGIKGGYRFWAKLQDVNNIEADLLNPDPTSNYDTIISTRFPN